MKILLINGSPHADGCTYRALREMEGILQGDRYQSIALHEDILFSYFEEPRTPGNLRRDTTLQSQTIQAWLDVNPESHFIPLPGSNGSNFLLLPQYFALGE